MYEATHKRTGEVCAIKVVNKYLFKQKWASSKSDPSKNIYAEFDVLEIPLTCISVRVGLIWSTLRYQFGSGTSERTMSEDSKNVF